MALRAPLEGLLDLVMDRLRLDVGQVDVDLVDDTMHPRQVADRALRGIPFVPGELAEERSGFVRFEGSCLLCTMNDAEESASHRVVHSDDRVIVVCPFWSGSPFEMLAVAKTHETHMARATPQDVVAVGRALRNVLERLRRTVGDVAYNVVFHTAPHHQHDEHFHWHAHVMPRVTSIAGFEQGTGVLINIVSPELAAQQLTASD